MHSRACGPHPWPPLPSPPSDALVRPAGIASTVESVNILGTTSNAGESTSRSIAKVNPIEMRTPAGKIAASLRDPKPPRGFIEDMPLHVITGVGGEMRLDRGRRRYNANDEATHERVIQGSGSVSARDDDPAKWLTSSLANHDPKKVSRATRRLAKQKMLDASRNFHRCCTVPEDEEAAIAHRRAEQEAEWRSLLCGQKLAGKSRASCASSITDTTKAMSMVTAGIKSHDVALRMEDNRCAAYGRICMSICPGDNFPRKPPLPLEYAARVSTPRKTEYEDYKAAGGSERLARLLRLDMRP